MTPRYLIVAGDFTPLGGMDVANHALARYLASRGDVHLVTHRAWPDLVARPSITVHHVPRPFDRHLLGGPLLARAGRRIWRRLQPLGVRVVVNGGNCRIAGANWVHYVHAAYEPSVAGSFARRAKSAFTYGRAVAAERAAVRDARLVICNSQRTKADVLAHIGVDASRVHVVYYGADPDRFSIVSAAERASAKAALGLAADRPLVGFVGALGDRRKAFDVVFQAWRALCRRRDWDADLLVVGSGAELPAWQRRTAEARLDTRIRFIGFRRDVPAVLAALDGFVHPARYEAYGLAVQEALCLGVPAIVSAASGIAERYPRELADLLIDDPDHPGELIERLSLWRGDFERFRSVVTAFSASLLQRSWNTMAEEIARLVEATEAA